MYIPNVPEECDLPGMGRYMVETSELGLECEGWSPVRNHFGKLGKHISNVTDLGPVITIRYHMLVTLQM